MTRLEALARGQQPLPEAPCCPFHATGGHPDDRHGFDPAGVVYAPDRKLLASAAERVRRAGKRLGLEEKAERVAQLHLAQEPRP